MKFTKRLAIALGATALAIAGLAAPAQAAPSPATLYFGGPAGSTTDCSVSLGIYSDAAHTAAVTAFTGTSGNITIQNDCSIYPVAYTTLTGSGSLPGTVFQSGAHSSTFTSLSGTGTFTLYRCPINMSNAGSTGSCLSPIPNNTLAGTASYSFASGGAPGGGGAPSSSSSSSAAAPTETLSLAVAASGATCTGGNPTGVSGSWLTLPSADQCSQSGPTAKAGATLLGWSTSENFPIARAQSQIDKHWGVIDESIDGIRMIFIPAGMAVFVSGSNNLYPVWSK